MQHEQCELHHKTLAATLGRDEKLNGRIGIVEAKQGSVKPNNDEQSELCRITLTGKSLSFHHKIDFSSP